MIERRAARTAIFLAITAGLMAFVILANTPDRSIFGSAVSDAGHAPLFGLFALMVLWAASARGSATGDQSGSLRIRNHLMALTVTVAFGGLTEIL